MALTLFRLVGRCIDFSILVPGGIFNGKRDSLYILLDSAFRNILHHYFAHKKEMKGKFEGVQNKLVPNKDEVKLKFDAAARQRHLEQYEGVARPNLKITKTNWRTVTPGTLQEQAANARGRR